MFQIVFGIIFLSGFLLRLLLTTAYFGKIAVIHFELREKKKKKSSDKKENINGNVWQCKIFETKSKLNLLSGWNRMFFKCKMLKITMLNLDALKTP